MWLGVPPNLARFQCVFIRKLSRQQTKFSFSRKLSFLIFVLWKFFVISKSCHLQTSHYYMVNVGRFLHKYKYLLLKFSLLCLKPQKLFWLFPLKLYFVSACHTNMGKIHLNGLYWEQRFLKHCFFSSRINGKMLFLLYRRCLSFRRFLHSLHSTTVFEKGSFFLFSLRKKSFKEFLVFFKVQSFSLCRTKMIECYFFFAKVVL